jgi:hypothetical protein
MPNSGTILIKNRTKRRLKNVGHKDQTYDELINELLDLKNSYRHSFGEGTKNHALVN